MALDPIHALDMEWYPGTIKRANGDGTFQVKWNEPACGPKFAACRQCHMRRIPVFKARDRVKVNWALDPNDPEDTVWHTGTIEMANDDGTFQVKWDEPEGGPESDACWPWDMKHITVFKVGDAVEALDPYLGKLCTGVVQSANGDGSFQVKWDEPEGRPESS